MEAIVELIAAFFMAMLQLVLISIQAAAALLAMLVEFLFLALTQGTSPASERLQQRRQKRREARAAKARAAQQQPGPRPDTASAPMDRRRAAVVTGLVVVGIAAVTATWFVSQHIRKKRIEATEVQVASLADKFISEIKDEQAADPEEGLLADRDAWNQRIELFVDKMLLGSMVVVRSPGPDRQPGTIDDLLAIRVARAPAKGVAGELADRGRRAVRKRIARLLPGKEGKRLPDRIDLDANE